MNANTIGIALAYSMWKWWFLCAKNRLPTRLIYTYIYFDTIWSNLIQTGVFKQRMQTGLVNIVFLDWDNFFHVFVELDLHLILSESPRSLLIICCKNLLACTYCMRVLRRNFWMISTVSYCILPRKLCTVFCIQVLREICRRFSLNNHSFLWCFERANNKSTYVDKGLKASVTDWTVKAVTVTQISYMLCS